MLIKPNTYDFDAFCERTKALARRCGPLGPNDPILSMNTKTFFAFDLPIGLTCLRGLFCSRWCYGLLRTRLLPLDWVVEKHIKVLKYVMTTPPEQVADRVYEECLAHGLSFLRWFGCGDLVWKLVVVINSFNARHPDVISWVSTRKARLAAKIAPTENLFIGFSVDASIDSQHRFQIMKGYNHSRTFYSFLRTSAEEQIPEGINIVFNAQQAKGALPADDHPGICPADAGLLDTESACELCRRCFSPDILRVSVRSGGAVSSDRMTTCQSVQKEGG